jgi:hypothetical protein
MEVVALCTRASPGGSGRKVKLSVTITAVGTSAPYDVAIFTDSIVLLFNQ